MNIVLVEPEIPQNTGNIGRLCLATGSSLHLVGNLGFRTDDKYLKRAGLDYWSDVDVLYHSNFDDFERTRCKKSSLYIFSTKGEKIYTEASYGEKDYLVFGSESGGLSKDIFSKYSENCMKIPMQEKVRSLNLANSVGIVLYEALRQLDFF